MEVWKIILIICAISTIVLCCLSFYFIKNDKSKPLSIVTVILTFVSIFIGLYSVYISQQTSNKNVIEPNITLSSNSLELIIGDTYTINAITNIEETSINWNTNNDTIITVNNDGELIALSEGNAEISATITYKGNDYTSSCNILVKKPAIDLNVSTLTLFVEEQEILFADTFPDDSKVNWDSNASSIVSVDNNGQIVANKQGTAIVTASIIYNDKIYSSKCYVHVNNKPETLYSDENQEDENKFYENESSADELNNGEEISALTPLSSLSPVRIENAHGYLINSNYKTLQGTGYSENYIATSAGLNYDEVISVCSYTPFELIYNLGGKYSTLSGEIAFDDISISQNDIVGIKSTFNGEAQIIFCIDDEEEYPLSLNTTDFSQPFSINVEGANKLSINISFPYYNFVLDNFDKYFNIINAYLE